MDKMTVGSLFAGIGGFDLGFERAGYEIKFQVEIDKYANKVLEKHFPNAERFNDVRTVGKHNLPYVDVLVGGFPCQDISVAGKGAGIKEGTRSGLWSEFARIISEIRPRYVVVENVAALLGRGMGRVLGDLSEIGYDAEWRIISAADVGAPHLRKRIWIVAYPRYAGVHERRERSEARFAMLNPRGIEGDVVSRGQEVSGNVLANTPRILQGREDQRTERERTGESGKPVFEVADSVGHPSAEDRGITQFQRDSLPETGRQETPDGFGVSGGGKDELADARGVGGNGERKTWETRFEVPFGRRGSERGAEEVAVSDGRHVQRLILGGDVQENWRVPGERQAGSCSSVFRQQWESEPAVGRVAHGVPSRVDRLKCLGNAVVPQIPEWIARQILRYEEQHADKQQN